MMKPRLATPEHLVDLHGIGDLKGIQRSGNKVVIGAVTTQHELLASEEEDTSLKAYRDNKRVPPDTSMLGIMEKASNADIEALAHYVAHLGQ